MVAHLFSFLVPITNKYPALNLFIVFVWASHLFIYYFCRLGPTFIISRSDFNIKPIICLSLQIIMNKGPSMNIAVYKQCMLMSEHKNVHLFDFRSFFICTAGLLACQQLANILSLCFTIKVYGFKKQKCKVLKSCRLIFFSSNTLHKPEDRSTEYNIVTI